MGMYNEYLYANTNTLQYYNATMQVSTTLAVFDSHYY